MKKIILLLMLGMAVVSACKKDSATIVPPSSPTIAALIGKWTWVKNGDITDVGNADPNLSKENFTTQSQGAYQEFTSDWKFNYSDGGNPLSTTWEILDDQTFKTLSGGIRKITKLNDHELIYYRDYKDGSFNSRSIYYLTK
jgi:hypothetical protein